MIHFVNEEKLQRAKNILSLFSRPTRNEGEDELKRKFGELLAEAKIESKDKDAIKFVYEKLGGLIRTEEEEKEHEKQKEEIKKKRKFS